MLSKFSVALALFVSTAPGIALAQTTAPKPTTATTPPAVKAEPAKKIDVKALTATGEKKFKEKEYRASLEAFHQVMDAKPSPGVARYVGLAHDNLGELKEAVAAYEKYLETAPATKDQKAYDEIKARVGQLKTSPGKVMITTTPPGAAVMVDGKPLDKPTPTEAVLPPGPHKIAFNAEGREPTERDVEVAFASSQELTVELVEKPPPPPPPVAVTEPPPAEPPVLPPPAPEPRSKIPAYVTGGVAIVAAGIGTGFGIAALSKKSDYDKTPTKELADSGENAALIADMAFGVAITFGVTSLVLFLSDGGDTPTEKKASRSRFTASPIVTRDMGGATAGFRF